MLHKRFWINPCASRLLTGVVLGALALGTMASAQTTAAKVQESEEYSGKYEVGIFGGGSFFQSVPQGLGTQLANGGAVGARVTENFWRYVGLEQAFTYSVNNGTFLTPAGLGQPTYSFGSRLHQYTGNLLGYFTPRGSRFRPFVTIGGGAADFRPTDQAMSAAKLPINAPFGAQNLRSNLQPALNYGGGIKFHLSDRVGLRIDARGLMSRAPTFGLPDTARPGGGVYIPRGLRQYGIQTTAGLDFYFGRKVVAPPPPPPPPPAPRAEPLGNLTAGIQLADSGVLCQGKAITLRSTASDPAGRPLTYKWMVNGRPVGGNTPELQFTPDAAGNFAVTLEVSAPNSGDLPTRVATGGPVTLNVQEYRVPTATACSATPATANYGDTVNFSSTGAGSPCSTIRYAWTVSEGTLSSTTNPTTSLDTKTLQFTQNGRVQTKTVTATATVTDDRGASAKCTADVRVTYTPQAIRFSDLIFGKGSARVNNCAKRILLEELAPKAADMDYEVVLVGHFDADEAPKGRAPRRTLDEQRVLNTIGVLSGGTGTCARLDRSRIKADWVGTEQISDKQPGLCGTSARAAAKERKGSMVSNADENRRVEVWLVPKGTTNPSSFKAPKTVDEKVMKSLGCPK